MTGRWIERTPSYLSFDVYNCRYCGKNVPRSIWLETVDGADVPFCSAEVAAIHLEGRTYPDNHRRSDAELGLTEELRAIRAACPALRDRTSEPTDTTGES